MNKFSVKWFNFWRRRKWLFAVILMACTALFVLGSRRLVINEDITKTLPKSEGLEKLAELFELKGLNSSLYFSITPAEPLTTEELLELGSDFRTSLQNETDTLIKNIRFELEEDELGAYDFVDERIPFFLTEADYQTIEKKLAPDSVKKVIRQNHETLFTPEGFFLKKFLMQDPLGVSATGLKQFEKVQSDQSFVVEEGVFLMPDRTSLFITAELNYNPKDALKNAVLAEKLEHIKSTWDQNYKVDYFSSFLIGYANSKQIKIDTQLTLWISVIGILALLFFYYRSFLLPFFFIVPAFISLLFAVSVIAVTKGEISAISIGAGAIVLGIIMDYSFHFFTHLKHSSSIEETLKDVTIPLLTGCLTTTLAFLALMLTNSPVLQDFGLFSALSLIGAAFGVLFILPVVLPGRLEKKWKAQKTRSFTFKLPRPFRIATALGITAFTVVAFIFASDIEFDDDLMNLNFYPDDLKAAEKKFNNIDPNTEKRVFILSEGVNQNEASEINFEVNTALKELKDNGQISDYLNTALFQIPKNEESRKLARWNTFWKQNGNELGTLLDTLETELGYYPNTFDTFKLKISGNYQIDDRNKPFPMVSADLEKLVDSTGGQWKYISYFTVSNQNKESVLEQLNTKKVGTHIIDRSEITHNLVKTVQSDFNFILLASSLLVFICLLVVYGRIELALITFLPMILSWVWILGIAALLGIKFNFVNIIISTFIFGLGDDFAIFITDGFVSKFARNKDVIKPYRQGILLSATTTIIGTGVLIFAKHPAIHSISLIAVIGMIAILIISFTVQPYLLRKLLTERKEKGLPPVSLINFVSSIASFSFFIVGCASLFPLQFIFRFIPFGQKKLKLFYHHLMRIFAWSLVHSMFHVRKKVHHRENFDFKNPSIIIANHQSFIDVLSFISFHPKVIILTNDWVYNSPIFGAQIRYLGFLAGSHGIDENIAKARPWVEDGYTLVVFPEGTRSADKKIGRFHKGAFYMAEQLNLDITPVLLHGYNDTMKKNDYILLSGTLNTVVLPRISPTDNSYGITYKEKAKNISAEFKTAFKNFDLTHSDSSYLRPKIISAYIFKSPFIEWYVRVKWIFERKNFDFYHTLIPVKGKIMDLGCGFGYLSYYLQMRSADRELIGVDYDADKIEIANNCYPKNEKINFVAADVRQTEIENVDAVFLNDVLHYLPGEDHEKVLLKCIDGLNKNGVLIVRDGVTDMENRHKKTELTEKYSTQIIGFNKAENELCFFSRDFILNFAENNGLSCEIKEQSNNTSNILFILKKIEH